MRRFAVHSGAASENPERGDWVLRHEALLEIDKAREEGVQHGKKIAPKDAMVNGLINALYHDRARLEKVVATACGLLKRYQFGIEDDYQRGDMEESDYISYTKLLGASTLFLAHHDAG